MTEGGKWQKRMGRSHKEQWEGGKFVCCTIKGQQGRFISQELLRRHGSEQDRKCVVLMSDDGQSMMSRHLFCICQKNYRRLLVLSAAFARGDEEEESNAQNSDQTFRNAK